MNFAPKPDKTTAENATLLKQEIKKELVQKKNNKRLSKPLHGKYPSIMGKPHVELPNTNNWLRSEAETEGLLIARPNYIHMKLSKTQLAKKLIADAGCVTSSLK